MLPLSIKKLLEQIPDQDRQDQYFQIEEGKWKTRKDVEHKKIEPSGFFQIIEWAQNKFSGWFESGETGTYNDIGQIVMDPPDLDIDQFSDINIDKRIKTFTSPEYLDLEKSCFCIYIWNDGGGIPGNPSQYNSPEFSTPYLWNCIRVYSKHTGNPNTIVTKVWISLTGKKWFRILYHHDIEDYYHSWHYNIECAPFKFCKFERAILDGNNYSETRFTIIPLFIPNLLYKNQTYYYHV